MNGAVRWLLDSGCLARIGTERAENLVETLAQSGIHLIHVCIDAERGKRLRFRGPLGLSGQAVDVVTTYEFLPDPAGTKLRLTCNVSGQMEEGEDKIVDSVWHHFLFERLKPYIESGQYKKKAQ